MQRLLILVLIALASAPARADTSKASVAVLGLEAGLPARGQAAPTAATITVAGAFTAALRNQVKAGKDHAGALVLGPGTEVDLVAAADNEGCKRDTLSCIARIGAGLGVDYVIYGKVSRVRTGYRGALRLLRVRDARLLRPLVWSLATSEARGGKLARRAKAIFADLTSPLAAP